MVAKSGLKPALMYGCKCLGLGDFALQRLRVAISACLSGNADFNSTTMRLVIDSADPTGEVTAAPIVAWSSALWDSTTEVRILTAAWRMQMIRMPQGL